MVSNREPYIHVRRGDRIEVQRPASGLVTALEPIMRACSGTWIAHGSGSADREVVDRHDRVAVPPEKPAYRIRRVWLTAEEEAGYYYGFANEGLWPLCHIAHVRPTFRAEDWEQYVAVNQQLRRGRGRGARSTEPDRAGAGLPLRAAAEADPRRAARRDHHHVLAHSVAEPRGVRRSARGARSCWRGCSAAASSASTRGSTVNNFVDTVDRVLEARVDRETFTVTYGGRDHCRQALPDLDRVAAREAAQLAHRCRSAVRAVRARYAIGNDVAIGIGVDRLDYTKGILERFRAVERLLELEPQWIGRFTFVQICRADALAHRGVPGVRGAGARAGGAASTSASRRGSWSPIVLRVEHAEPPEVYEHFRAADCASCRSLHDGMNLVAKEFVAARDDERGVLILSQFTGAARELPEALIVNPYDTDQCAAALHLALTMPAGEQRDRMHIMRGLVREFNVYRWAGRMLLDAATMRRRGRITERAGGAVVPLRREGT